MNRAEDSILILATILLVVTILTISDFPTMFLISMTTCVDQWTDKVQRVVSGVLSVLMALIDFAVFSIRYLWLYLLHWCMVQSTSLSVYEVCSNYYDLIMLFHINVTSAPMVAFVFYSQIAVSAFPNSNNKFIFNTSVTYYFLNIPVAFDGILELRLLSLLIIISPFCVSL